MGKAGIGIAGNTSHNLAMRIIMDLATVTSPLLAPSEVWHLLKSLASEESIVANKVLWVPETKNIFIAEWAFVEWTRCLLIILDHIQRAEVESSKETC